LRKLYTAARNFSLHFLRCNEPAIRGGAFPAPTLRDARVAQRMQRAAQHASQNP